MLALSYSGPLWHVIYTAPRAERRVLEGIGEELKYEVYLPVERLRGNKPDTSIERPLFARYLFVQVDPYRQDWQPLLDIDGVSDVLRNNNIPSHVPAAWIEAIRKAEAVGIFDRTTRLPRDLNIGDIVRVEEGPFAGHRAVIQEFIGKLRSATASKRARVLVAFMGRAAMLDLSVTSLEKV